MGRWLSAEIANLKKSAAITRNNAESRISNPVRSANESLSPRQIRLPCRILLPTRRLLSDPPLNLRRIPRKSAHVGPNLHLPRHQRHQVGCGRRDGEVVKTIEDFAGMKDSRSGLLPDHTVINYNTSSIPLAAREASTYMRITLGSTTGRWGSMHSLQV
jgi:hypothetical protein